MESKWLVQYSWQASLLCVFICFSTPVLAKRMSEPATKKPNAKTPIKAKLKPIGSATPTTLTPGHPGPQLRPVQSGQSLRPAKPVLIIAKEHKPVVTATSSHTTSRYVIALKETKRHTLVKTLVALPVTRSGLRSRERTFEARLSLRKSHEVLLTRVVALPAASPPPSPMPPVRTNAAPGLTLPSTSGDAIRPSQTLPLPTSLSPSQTITLSSARSLSETPTASVPPSISVASDPRPLPPVPAAPVAKNGTITFVEHQPTNPFTQDDISPKDWPNYTPQKAPFAATVNGDRLGYRINSIFVLPGDELFVEISEAQKKAAYTIHSAFGPERLLSPRRWYWVAPSASGLYPVKIVNSRTHGAITLNVFVMLPREQVQDGYLNGYRIGSYPTETLRQLPMYIPPRGLIEVTPENENTLVSPHFRLRQFLCKQDGGYPKYMILDAHLLTTLEQVLELANAGGYRARTFSVMSGYRTPYYNRAIGNRTTYSRHLWGDAADIFIDEDPRDGKMDDLNQDGVIDAHDAEVIYQLIENASEPRLQKAFLGGLARYRETSSHGPFVHVDTRGVYARWGIKTLTRGGTTPAETDFQMKDQSLSQPSFLDTQSTPESTP